MNIKLILILPILLFCSCSEKIDKNEKAKQLYTRICQTIYNNTGNSSSSDFTTEWKNVENNIIENKDTLFMVYNNEFQILVTKKIHIQPTETKDTSTKDTSITTHTGW